MHFLQIYRSPPLILQLRFGFWFVKCLQFFVFFQEGKRKIKVAASAPPMPTITTTTTTTNVSTENDENGGKDAPEDAPEEQKAPPRTHTLDDDDAQSVIAMELCPSVEKHFAAMPMVDLVWCIFWKFWIFLCICCRFRIQNLRKKKVLEVAGRG